MPTTRSHLATFAGFSSPNYTQVPDELFDQLMPQLADAELRVLLYIVRRTFGFKREADAISLSQMVSGITTKDGQVLDHGTGLSKATVARGLAGLRNKGVILAERNSSQMRGDEPTTYRLHIKHESTQRNAQSDPVSQQRDTPRVSIVRQAVSQQRDTQERGDKKTDFELSKEETFVDKTEKDQHQPPPSRSQLDQRGSRNGLTSLAVELRSRAVPKRGGEDRAAITVAIERLAGELGDQAKLKATITRAMNLFTAANVHRDVFIDVLHQAKGEVRDRRQHPGNAPLPKNQMAYFFAVVEDRLGYRTK
jgi:Bacteriophage replication protein O